jgi:fructuronate reductase
MDRLSRSTLAYLPAQVRKPTVDLSRLETGIVQMGVGAFHRAHQAVCTDNVIEAGDTRWVHARHSRK